MTPYPVRFVVPPSEPRRNRLTVGFRPLLAIPHIILVGPMAWSSRRGGPGLLGAAAYFLTVVNWFSVVFTGALVPGIREFAIFYLRWRARATAYQALLVDPYPPFSDAPYPTGLEIDAPGSRRDRLSIAFRAILAIPHFIAVFFILVAWCVITVVAWFAILFTGVYPAALYAVAAGALQWVLRVEAYLLLLTDAYPPFDLSIEPRTGLMNIPAIGLPTPIPPPLHAS